MFRGKNYKEAAKQIDRATLYDPQDAFELVCKTSKAKFDETVELHVKLGVDGRHADQQVRGALVLPNGTGKSVRVLVFCTARPSRSRKPSPQAPITPVAWTMWKRSRRRTGSSSTPSSPLPT